MGSDWCMSLTGLPRLFLKILESKMPFFMQFRLLKIGAQITNNPDLEWYLGKIMEEKGNLNGAICSYEAAINRVDRLDEVSSTRRQAYQFSLEKARYLLGKPSAKDPLHHCRIYPGRLVSESSLNNCAGYFQVGLRYNGLLVETSLKNNHSKYIDLMINGVPFYRLKVSMNIKNYRFTIRRPALSYFPSQGELTARLSDGSYLLFEGSKLALLEIPHGSGDICDLLKERGFLEKKGNIPLTNQELHRRQLEYLNLYARARDFFDAEIGRSLFLIYGTLLGFYREGDFIQGDDDFDVAYISEEGDPLAVKEEAKNIIVNLVRAGFTVAFNQSGRPFRLRDSYGGAEIHLDIRPIWFQDGKVWAHKQACLSCTLDDFRSFKKEKFRDTEVYIPNKPEVFLKAYYGPEWKVPDPNYSNNSVFVPADVRKNLALACLTTGEFRSMRESLQSERIKYPNMGDLISNALQDLYPLEDYEVKCGWR
ncbi:MAG: hypothetical protein R6V16_07460 [Bacteroidales bacterium]